MSDITFEATKSFSALDKKVEYTVRRVFTSSHYDSIIRGSSPEDVEKFHYFIQRDMEMQLKRMIEEGA